MRFIYYFYRVIGWTQQISLHGNELSSCMPIPICFFTTQRSGATEQAVASAACLTVATGTTAVSLCEPFAISVSGCNTV